MGGPKPKPETLDRLGGGTIALIYLWLILGSSSCESQKGGGLFSTRHVLGS